MVEHEKRNNGLWTDPSHRDLVYRSMPYSKAVISVQTYRCLCYINPYRIETFPAQRVQEVPETATKVEYGPVPRAVDVQPVEDIVIRRRPEPQAGILEKGASLTQPVGEVLQVVACFEPLVRIIEQVAQIAFITQRLDKLQGAEIATPPSSPPLYLHGGG